MIFLILDFFYESFEVYEIYNNAYFDRYYLKFYIIFVLFLLLAAFMATHYLVSKDRAANRRIVPWAFFVSGLSNIGLTLLIILYITYGYLKSPTHVFVNGIDANWADEKPNEDDDVEAGYAKVLKLQYILIKLIGGPLISGLFNFIFYFELRIWQRERDNIPDPESTIGNDEETTPQESTLKKSQKINLISII